jgi:hypothetical protein
MKPNVYVFVSVEEWLVDKSRENESSWGWRRDGHAEKFWIYFHDLTAGFTITLRHTTIGRSPPDE